MLRRFRVSWVLMSAGTRRLVKCAASNMMSHSLPTSAVGVRTGSETDQGNCGASVRHGLCWGRLSQTWARIEGAS